MSIFYIPIQMFIFLFKFQNQSQRQITIYLTSIISIFMKYYNEKAGTFIISALDYLYFLFHLIHRSL